jgi:class 3 adenylate cyclase/tetratricopeptide (TPR) repeat protein
VPGSPALSYQPAPIDNSSIELSKELSDLVELLARNNHDLWAKRRTEEGWRYGPRRDDEKKETPMLVPYENLPESEKQYDRDNAIEALKTIIALGGHVEAPAPALKAGERGADVTGLLASWRSRKPRQLTLQQYQELGKRANKMGESLIACDIADEGLKNWEKDKELRQIKALALARMGSSQQAHEILSQLRKEANDDEETLGLLARTYKDLWILTGDPKDLAQAHDGYTKAYNHAPGRYWTGINAATLGFAKGERETASELASQIRATCLERLKTATDGDVLWLTATIAEASLLLEEFPEAERWYAQAVRMAQNDLGNLGTMWRNARIILKSMPPEIGARIERALHMPKVAVFTGHRVDEAGRPQPRFPNELAPVLQTAIQGRLIASNVRIGYSGAASGADILFLEAMLALGGRTHIVLPCNPDQFIAESVASSGADWTRRFSNALSSADEVIIASDQRLKFGSVAYDYANELAHGLATVRAGELDTELVRVAVWDGAPGDGPGGAADIVARWQAGGHAVDIINPLDLLPSGIRPNATPRSRPTPPAETSTPDLDSAIRALLFADAYHFSKLGEEQMPPFTANFLGPIAALVRETTPQPVYQNTWGDGLFFVFENVGDAGRFALKLADCVAAIDRTAAGLPEQMSLRIALHAGPVYRFKDRIIDRLNYIGSHVNRAARIEPVTPPGQVYSSDAFAALAALQAPGEFRFDYIGRIPLAKSFGEFPMYHMQKRNARQSRDLSLDSYGAVR